MAGWSAKLLAKAGAWRLADGFFGGWGVARRLTSARGTELSPGQVRSILAIRLDLLGDLVFTLPALAVLRDAAPQARQAAYRETNRRRVIPRSDSTG